MNTGPQPLRAARFEAGAAYVLDRARIEVALEARQRYRYVHPRVVPAPGGAGWEVFSPNCSRRIDPSGGDIAIAWLEPADEGAPGAWRLHARDHAQRRWRLCLQAASLSEALDRLVEDPQREFWA